MPVRTAKARLLPGLYIPVLSAGSLSWNGLSGSSKYYLLWGAGASPGVTYGNETHVHLEDSGTPHNHGDIGEHPHDLTL